MSMRCLAVVVLLTLFCPTLVLAEGDLWLAVGYGGRRMISTDGKAWEITAEWAQPGGDDSNNLMGAVYAQGKFVVVGGGGGGSYGPSGGHILVSKDGRDWKEVVKEKARVNPIVFGGDRFIVGTSEYPSGRLMWSKDGETWSKGAKIEKPGLTHFRHGAFGNGVFVLVGNGSVKDAEGKPKPISWAVASPDGEKITTVATDLPSHGTLQFGAGRFVMVSHEGMMLTSTDGKEWKEQPFEKADSPRWLVWDKKRFLAGNGKVAWQSKDGVKWDRLEFPSRASVKWSDGRRFIATSWPGQMSFSAGGKTWEPSPKLTANGINVVVKAE